MPSAASQLSVARLATFIFCLLLNQIHAADPVPRYPTRPMSELSPAAKAVYLNQTGDCVQDSLAMNGVQRGDLNAASLLWDTDYGPKQLGGSSPSRVARYAKERGLAIYNVTGSFDDIERWSLWACKTGRFAAIGYFGNHFQYLYGFDADAGVWRVQNNWGGTFEESYAHSPQQFRQHVLASGPWMVILKGPPAAPNPRYW